MAINFQEIFHCCTLIFPEDESAFLISSNVFFHYAAFASITVISSLLLYMDGYSVWFMVIS